MRCSTSGSSALHCLLESAQILVHWVVIYILKCISNKIFIRVVCWKLKSAHEKNQHTWIDILCSWIRTLNTVRTSILLTLIYRFNIIAIKIAQNPVCVRTLKWLIVELKTVFPQVNSSAHWLESFSLETLAVTEMSCLKQELRAHLGLILWWGAGKGLVFEVLGRVLGVGGRWDSLQLGEPVPVCYDAKCLWSPWGHTWCTAGRTAPHTPHSSQPNASQSGVGLRTWIILFLSTNINVKMNFSSVVSD